MWTTSARITDIATRSVTRAGALADWRSDRAGQRRDDSGRWVARTPVAGARRLLGGAVRDAAGCQRDECGVAVDRAGHGCWTFTAPVGGQRVCARIRIGARARRKVGR